MSACQKHQIPGVVVSLSRDDVLKIARLARLQITEQEIAEVTGKLESILAMAGQLQATDTTNVLPMAHPLDASQRLRADEVTESNHRDDYQRNAQAIERGLYLVPRVLE